MRTTRKKSRRAIDLNAAKQVLMSMAADQRLAKAKKNKMSKKSTRLLATVLSIVIFAGALYIFNYRPFSKKAEPSESGAAPSASQPDNNPVAGALPVTAMVAIPGPLQDVIYVNGSTVAADEVLVTSEVPGMITKIHFREGSVVTRGALLVQLEVDELKAQRDRLLVRKVLTSSIAERLKNLYDKEGVSLQEYEIAAAEAEQVQAELALIDVQIDKRSIRAPFSGVLGLRQVSEGSFISPGAPIVNLVNTNPIHIEFSVPERYSDVLSQGSAINFQLSGLTENYQAAVIAKEPYIDPTTRTLRLKASAPNPSGKILPGAFANVTVKLRSYESTILIPTEAIVPELGGKRVYLYRNGQAQPVEVETGIRKDALIQVLSGIQPGDTVITSGVMQIRADIPLTITQLRTTP
jgi:membrane fusion protein (multidrug efflux system)